MDGQIQSIYELLNFLGHHFFVALLRYKIMFYIVAIQLFQYLGGVFRQYCARRTKT